MKKVINKFGVPVIISIIIVGGLVPLSFSSDQNLFVTPELAQSGIFYAHQVVEVKIIDPDISDINEAKGEPDVTVNGKILRMVQAIDGNWYGYFADRDMAQIADSATIVNGEPLDFGTFCDSNSIGLTGPGEFLFSAPSSLGLAVPGDVTGGVQGTTTIAGSTTCSSVAEDTPGTPDINVFLEAKDININAPNSNTGQINVVPEAWFFIQLYSLTDGGNVDVQYNKGGSAQIISLDFLDQSPSIQTLIEGLILQVQNKDLSAKTESQLIQSLEKILNILNDGNPKNDKNICKSLDVFINKVESQAGKQISLVDAQDLIDSINLAKQIICN